MTVIHPDLTRSTEDPTLLEKEAEVHSILDNSIARAQVESHHVEMKSAHLLNDGYISSSILEGGQQVQCNAIQAIAMHFATVTF